jgi:16S rRNA (guanine1207-N2)-methyltransferase
MIDSNTRAIQCTEQGVTQNHVCGAQVLLNHDGQISIEADIDVALLNPPYYGDFTIAEHFVTTASRYLAPRGRVVIVTKQHTQYLRHAWTRLQLQQIQERSGYQILTYGRRGA